MKISALLLFGFLFLFSCKKNKTSIDIAACGVNNPVTELSWLKDLIKKAKDTHEENITTVTLFEWNGKSVFNYYVSYCSCSGCVNYYCDGTKLDMSKFTEAETKEFREKLFDASGKKRIIWPQ